MARALMKCTVIPAQAGSVGSGGIGNFITILHNEGTANQFYATYMHLQQGSIPFGVGVGDIINAGSVIGFVGDTGYRTGTHLHFHAGTSLVSVFGGMSNAVADGSPANNNLVTFGAPVSFDSSARAQYIGGTIADTVNNGVTPRATGNEFLVNTITHSQQTAPDMCTLSDGRSVVTWMDASGTSPDTSFRAIRGQVFNADGSRIRRRISRQFHHLRNARRP